MATITGSITIVCVDLADYNTRLAKAQADPAVTITSQNQETLTFSYDIDAS